MSKVEESKLYRIIDANLNRSKEGLRVCEDICRFILDDKVLTSQIKTLRHSMTEVIRSLKFFKMIQARNIEGDVGKASIAKEFKRKDVAHIFYVNSQRAKESIRVLEEMAKLFNVRTAQSLKELRYKIYAIEKKIADKL